MNPKTPFRAAARALLPLLVPLLWASAASAAAPAPGAGLQAGQPPVLSQVRIDGGATVTWDPSVAVTWTSQGQATEWRIGLSGWMALPSVQPYKLILAASPQDGNVYNVDVQLRNVHGQSEVRSAAITYRAPPQITSASVESIDKKNQVLVRLRVAAPATRWAVSAGPTPPSEASRWGSLGAGAGGELAVLVWLQNPPPFPEPFAEVGTLRHGQTYTLHVHTQRETSPVQTRAVSFVYQGPMTDFRLEGTMLGLFVERLGQKQLIASRLMTTPLGGGCAIQTAPYTWPGGVGMGQQGLYATAGTGPMVSPVRCEFDLFGGQALKPGWTLTSLTPMAGTGCALRTATYGASPRVFLEATLDADPNVTAFTKVALCQVETLTMRGPWSDGAGAADALP